MMISPKSAHLPGSGVQIPIFVISLARAPDRRDAISKHLTSLGLKFEVIDATDGIKLSQEEQLGLLAPGVKYVPGVIGCYLSHIGVYKKIIDENITVALVLEDDARLNPDIVPSLRKGLNTFDFDYCLLDCDDVSEDTPAYYDPDSKELLAPGFPIYQTNIGPALLHAYLMTQTGARRRVEHAWPIYKPVDVYSHLPYTPKILVCVSPKGAWVSEHSRQSFTSERHDTKPLRLRILRRFTWFFRLRDWLTLKPIKGMLAVEHLKQQGILPANRRWRPMPTGRNVSI